MDHSPSLVSRIKTEEVSHDIESGGRSHTIQPNDELPAEALYVYDSAMWDAALDERNTKRELPNPTQRETNYKRVVEIALQRTAEDAECVTQVSQDVFRVVWKGPPTEQHLFDFSEYPAAKKFFTHIHRFHLSSNRWAGVYRDTSDDKDAASLHSLNSTELDSLQSLSDTEDEKSLNIIGSFKFDRRTPSPMHENQRWKEQRAWKDDWDAADENTEDNKTEWPAGAEMETEERQQRQPTEKFISIEQDIITSHYAKDVQSLIELEKDVYFIKWKQDETKTKAKKRNRQRSEDVDETECLLDLRGQPELQSMFVSRLLPNPTLLQENAEPSDKLLWQAVKNRWHVHVGALTDLGEGAYIINWLDPKEEATIVNISDCSEESQKQFNMRFGLPQVNSKSGGGYLEYEPPNKDEQTSPVIEEDLDNITLDTSYDSDSASEFETSRSPTPTLMSNFAHVRRQIGSHQQAADGNITYWSIDGEQIPKPSLEDIDEYWLRLEPFSNNHIELSSSEDDWDEARRIIKRNK